jgi:HlyD family secretion protein
MKKRIIPVVLLLLIVAGVSGYRWWSERRNRNSDTLAVSGTVEATEARLGFQGAGRITEISAIEGERVAAGSVLARLDSAQIVAQRGQAVARVHSANAILAELQSGSRVEEIGTASAALDAARERLEDARRDLARSKRLYDGGAISLEAYQKSQLAVELAEAGVKQAGEQRQLVQKGPRTERIEAQRAQVREAEAAVAAVDALLTNTQIVAPIGGVVTVKHREVNETVAPGQPVVTLMNPNDRWVRVYVPEHVLGAVSLGARAEIRSDTYPDHNYSGRVVFIAEEAEFTPKNVQTAEERVKLVYAVKVKIEGDPGVELKPGMPVDVVIRKAEGRGQKAEGGPLESVWLSVISTSDSEERSPADLRQSRRRETRLNSRLQTPNSKLQTPTPC